MTEHDLNDLATLSILADMMGVAQTALSNYQVRHEDFPRPIKVVGRTRLWSKDQVLEWWVKRLTPDQVQARIELGERLKDLDQNG